jgi:hypothetical protein
MALNLSNLLAMILAEGPTLFADLDAEFNAIAHGQGGAAKIANAAQGAAAIAGVIAKAVASLAAPAPPAVS